MQIIQSIRNRAAIATAAIAIAIIAFILLDAKNGSGKLFSGSSSSLGSINGVNIDVTDFEAKVKSMTERYGEQASGMSNQIHQNVWDQEVTTDVLNTEFDKLGLKFSPKELSAIMFSNEAPQELQQAFTDKTTGQYDISKAEAWWKQVKKEKDDQPDKIQANGLVEQIALNALAQKYSALLSSGAYYPTWMQAKDNVNAKTFATISYVSVPYSTISDSSIKVNDDDITAYVKSHAAMYKTTEEGRYISYVSFSTNPSSQDTAKTFQQLADLKPALSADTNAEKFVTANMSSVEYDNHYIYKSKLSMPQKDTVAKLAVGNVFGPYIDGKNFVLAKMLATRELPDSVKCRHILIKIADQKSGQIRPDSTARKLIDSIAMAIKGGASFDSMVLKYSDDAGSKYTKGEYTFAYTSQLVDSFYRTVFYDPIGTKKIIKGESLQGEGAYIGYHYIEVLNQWKPEPAYQIAFMAKEIQPSDETVDMAQANATKLSGEAKDIQSFNDYTTKNHLRKIESPTSIKESDFQINDLQDARQVVKWAFGAKEGDVSEPFIVGNAFVVAILNKIAPIGLPDAATARPLVEKLIIQQKKATIISNKIGAATTLENAAAAYSLPVQTTGADSSLTFNSPIISGVGQEPALIGASFDKEYQAKISPAISGTSGVFVLKVNSIGAKPDDSADAIAKQNASHEKEMVQQINNQYSGWFQSLKKTADIKDNRSKFY